MHPIAHSMSTFNLKYFLAELERSEGIALVAYFKTAMALAKLTDADRNNMTEKTVSTLLKRARELHAEHAGQ